MKGTVAKWFDDKGYGFIRPDGAQVSGKGRDIFVHHSNVERSGREHVSLVEGQRVEFETADGQGGRKEAQGVRLVS